MSPDYLSKYTYRIDWNEEDKCFLGRCLEFPSLLAHGDSREEALKEIQLVVVESVKWMSEEHEELPIPLSVRNYSGRLLLRIPPETHKRISIEAAEERISLNQFITSLLESRQSTVSAKREIDANLHSINDRLNRIETEIHSLAVTTTSHMYSGRPVDKSKSKQIVLWGKTFAGETACRGTFVPNPSAYWEVHPQQNFQEAPTWSNIINEETEI